MRVRRRPQPAPLFYEMNDMGLTAQIRRYIVHIYVVHTTVMLSMKNNRPLLLNFATEATATQATRDMLSEIAAKLGVNETKAAHIAINRLHMALFEGDLQEIDASKALGPTEAAKALRGLEAVFATIPALERAAAKSSAPRAVTPKATKAEKQRPLKFWNGRGYCCKRADDPRWEKLRHNAAPHAYVAAYSRADAARVIAGYTGRTPPDSELREYWSPAWGNAMQGIKPVRGLWLQFDHTKKPVRVTK